LTGIAHFLAVGLPEPDIGAVAAERPCRFAAAIYPLHGMLGEHLYAQLHPGGETATEAALVVSTIPEELTGTVPTALSLELLEMCFPVPPSGVLPDEVTPYPLPFPSWLAPLVALDHGDVVAHRAIGAVPQVLRAWMSTSEAVYFRSSQGPFQRALTPAPQGRTH
jgi:hypothetical protein